MQKPDDLPLISLYDFMLLLQVHYANMAEDNRKLTTIIMCQIIRIMMTGSMVNHNQSNGISFAKDDLVSAKEEVNWQIDDLCLKCQAIALPFVPEEESDDTQFVHHLVTKDSTCAMCAVFKKLLLSQDIQYDDPEVAELEMFWDLSEPEDRLIHVHTIMSKLPQAKNLSKYLVPLNLALIGGSYYRDLTPAVDYDVAREWMSCCARKHDQCKPPDLRPFSIPGFKLIDCETKIAFRPTRDVEYVALSYVWGFPAKSSVQAKSSRTTTTMDSLTGSPLVIQDAIKVTLQLGLRYLWVDQICIDQNDPNEQSAQIDGMHVICK